MGYKNHVTLTVDSSKRNTGLSNSSTDFLFQLTQNIEFHPKKQYFVRLLNVKIPVTFYNITSNYNTLVFNDGASGYTITLTLGNYTIDDLIAEIQVQMNATASPKTYTLTYDDITQLVNIAETGGSGNTVIDNDNTSTLADLIGFADGATINNASNADGSFVAYTNTHPSLRIEVSSLPANNYYNNVRNSDGSISTVRGRVCVDIPNDRVRNEYINFTNHDGPYIKLSRMSVISDFNVRLLDDKHRIVDLNNNDFIFTLSIDEFNYY
jgi:hypothetical protein